MNGLTDPRRVLLVLLAGDALFVAGHFAYLHDRTLSAMWHLGTDGGYPEKIVANAPLSEDNFFMVPKVVE